MSNMEQKSREPEKEIESLEIEESSVITYTKIDDLKNL